MTKKRKGLFKRLFKRPDADVDTGNGWQPLDDEMSEQDAQQKDDTAPSPGKNADGRKSVDDQPEKRDAKGVNTDGQGASKSPPEQDGWLSGQPQWDAVQNVGAASDGQQCTPMEDRPADITPQAKAGPEKQSNPEGGHQGAKPKDAQPAEIHGKESGEPAQDKGIWVQPKEYSASIIDGRYVLGDMELESMDMLKPARQPDDALHRPDFTAEAVYQGGMSAFCASIRGDMHYYTQTVRQDSYAIDTCENSGNGYIIAAIADGVSSAGMSHYLADYISRYSVTLIKQHLTRFGGYGLMEVADVAWQELAQGVSRASVSYCMQRANIKEEQLDAKMLLRFSASWASTLEFVIVQTNGEYVHVAVAGDGAAYIIDPTKGWYTLKRGKAWRSMASQEVNALPSPQVQAIVRQGRMNKGEQLFITTDGLGDMISNGGNDLGGFLLDRFQEVRSVEQFMQAMHTAYFQADDDRTGILFKEL